MFGLKITLIYFRRRRYRLEDIHCLDGRDILCVQQISMCRGIEMICGRFTLILFLFRLCSKEFSVESSS